MTDDDQGLVTPRGSFPLLRLSNGLVFISGTSARQPDNTIVGADVDEVGTTNLDIELQTNAVLIKIEQILATVELDRRDLVDVTSFLVTMNDFGRYNKVWSAFFSGGPAPARTTVAVHQLPHPHLLVEMKAVAALRGGRP